MPFFWEQGLKHEATILPDGRVARLSYEYLAVFFVLSYAVQLRWEIVGRDPADDQATTREVIEAEYGITLSEPGFWKRYSIFLALCCFLSYGIAYAAFQ